MMRLGIATAAFIVLLACAPAPLSGHGAPEQTSGGTPPARDPGRSRGENPEAMIDTANSFITRGRCEDAIPVLERMRAQYPQVAAANEMLAGCYLKTGRSQDAAALLERCLERDPANVSYLRDLGTAYVDLGRKEKAVDVWRRLLKDDERYASTYGFVAKLEQGAGLYDEAIETLREGTRFKVSADFYYREIIRLERLIGREADAFRDALQLLGGRPGALDSELRGVAEIFKESKSQERLAAIVDSIAGAGSDEYGTYRLLATAILIEQGRYDDARRRFFETAAPPIREEELHSLIVFMEGMRDRREDPGFASLGADLMEQFLDRFGASIYAPGVAIMMASRRREAARNAQPPERERLFEEALALADGMRRQRLGAPYLDSVRLFRAQVLFEDLHRGEDALRELAGILPPSGGRLADVEELRVRILLASGKWSEASTWLTRLAGGADTTLALLGSYGLGRLAFLTGRYEESMSILSDLAEKHPSSKWANDALELAMAIKGALGEGGGPLALYRGAVLARDRGAYPAAVDSLAALVERYPQSILAPQALFMKAGMEAASDEPGAGLAAARADFERLAEGWPLHDLAPRALEEIAGLAASDNPGEAAERYRRLMERYPDYPFMERVRERYIALQASVGAEAPKKGSE
jgi:tetratricopeptide (TPR) repeat protein